MIVENAGWLIGGGGLILFGVFLLWRTAGWDLTGAVADSAWQAARGRRSADNPTALDDKLNNIQSAATVTGKAGRVAGTVLGHFAAQVLGLVAIVAILAGAILVAVGLLWR